MVLVGPVVLDLADMGYEAIEMVQDFVLVAPLRLICSKKMLTISKKNPIIQINKFEIFRS